MEINVQEALSSLIAGYKLGLEQSGSTSMNAEEVESSLMAAFQSSPNFMEKLHNMDAFIDEHPELDAIREVLVDLLFIHFFSSDAQSLDDDYLESPEWEKIEDQTVERGTELLNLFLYIKECNEEEEDPELSHFLKEFLLVEEDEFQDEYYIYEEVIANQILVDAAQVEIAEAASKIKEDDEMKHLFYPFLSFFANTIYEPNFFDEFMEHSRHKAFDTAVLRSIYAYYHGSGLFNE